MPSRLLQDLHPEVELLCHQFLQQCKIEKVEVLVTCTWRSNKEQAELYAIGRTKPGRIVTNARPGASLHNLVNSSGRPAARAFDIVVLRHGKLVWSTRGNGVDNDPADDEKDDLELWQRAGLIGEKCGLEWAGNWTHYREFPHFQLPD